MDFTLRELSSTFTAGAEALLLGAGDIDVGGASTLSIRPIILIGVLSADFLRAVMEDLPLLAVLIADPATVKAHMDTILALLCEDE